MPTIKRPKINDNGMGLRIRTARTSLGLTCADLAAELDVRPNQVGRWENSLRDIPVSKLIRVCRSLKVSADHLLGVGG
jgi:transcriptional regulator with XRE-family HTH domain